MHNMHIVDIISKIAQQKPELRQDLIDLATLGYRDGLIQGKLNEIANTEDMDPSDIDEGDLAPSEMDEIIEDSENWFRNLMMYEARNMVENGSEIERETAQRYLDVLRKFGRGAKVDFSKFSMKKFHTNNRVAAAMEDLMKENPGLFE